MSSKTNSLESMCELIIDCPHSTPKWMDSGYVVLRNQNIRNGRLDLSAPSYTDKAGYESRIKRAIPATGDIVFTREAPMGEVCIIPEGLRCCLGQRQVLLRPRKNISGKYLYWALQSPFVQHQVSWNEGTGTTVSNVRIPVLKALQIPRRGSDEQAIADVLSSLANKIQLNDQINQTLEQMAQAIFKSWFVDFEPVKAKIAALEAGGSEDDALLAAMQAIAGSALFATDAADANAPTQLARLQTEHPEQYTTLRATAELFPSAMQESELGEIPEGWEETGFSDWVAIKRGRSITRAKVVPGDVPVVAGGLEPAYYHNEHNVIGPAITISASGANAGYVNLYHQNIWSSDSSYITKQGTPYFYTAYVCLKYYQKAIFDMQTGAAQPHIYPKDFERLKVVVGSDKLLEQLESLLISFFEQSAALKSESESLAQLRDTLLPKLLSGELSINKDVD